MSKIKYKAGEIIQVNLGDVSNPDQIKGHEQGKERPCVVIKSLHLMELVVIVPFTSKKPKRMHPYLVKIEKDGKALIYDSYALCQHIRTVSTKRITGKKGNISITDLDKIRFVLSDLLDIE